MLKLTTGLAAAAALAFLTSAGQACGFHASHQVTASIDKVEEGVSMSTHDGATLPMIIDEAVGATVAPECPADVTDCVPAEK